MFDITTHLKVGMEVTALVRIRTFNLVFIIKEHTFTVMELSDKLVKGMSIVDGSIAYFPYSQIQKIDGMNLNRYGTLVGKEVTA